MRGGGSLFTLILRGGFVRKGGPARKVMSLPEKGARDPKTRARKTTVRQSPCEPLCALKLAFLRGNRAACGGSLWMKARTHRKKMTRRIIGRRVVERNGLIRQGLFEPEIFRDSVQLMGSASTSGRPDR